MPVRSNKEYLLLLYADEASNVYYFAEAIKTEAFRQHTFKSKYHAYLRHFSVFLKSLGNMYHFITTKIQ